MNNVIKSKTKFFKGVLITLLAILSVCFFALGFSGLTNKSVHTEAAATAATKLKAWYKFDVASTFGTDATGNGYNLTQNPAGTYYSDSYNGMRFAQGATGSAYKVPFYASTTTTDPMYDLSLGSGVTITAALYLGESVGGGNWIIQNGAYDGDGGRPFGISYAWGTLSVWFNNVTVCSWNSSRIPTSSKNWYRIYVQVNGSTNVANMKLRSITTGENLAPTSHAGTLVSSSQSYLTNAVNYTLTTALASTNSKNYAFALGGQIKRDGTDGDGCIYGADVRIGDLRFYDGPITEGEEFLMTRGDTTRSNTLHEVVAYEFDTYKTNYNGSWDTSSNALTTCSIGWDTKGFQHLERKTNIGGTIYDNVTWENKDMAAKFGGPNSVLYSYGATSTSGLYTFNSGKSIDFSDYMRKGSFIVALRAKVCAGVTGAEGYYLFNTGRFAEGVSIGVSHGSIIAYVSRFDGSTDSQILTLGMSLSSTYEWVNVVLYTNGNYVYLAAKKDGGDWTQTNVEYSGASFGGYTYSFTIGGQSYFGQSTDELCYNASPLRDGVLMRSLKVFTGKWVNQDIYDIRDELDGLIPVVGTNDSFKLQAHYKFDGSTDIGKDSSGNGYDLVNPQGSTLAYSDYEGGVVLNYDNRTTAMGGTATNTSNYLYAPRGSGPSSNLDWSDKYTGSFAIAIRAKLSKGELGRVHKLYSTTRHGALADNYTGSHAGFQGSQFEIMVNGTVFYFSNVLDDTPSWYRIFFMYDDTGNNYLAVVFKETSSEYFVQRAAAIESVAGYVVSNTNLDFGGNAHYGFTIGAQSACGSSQDTGAGSGDGYYDPVISDFRFYSGVINTAEINTLLAEDVNNYYVDTNYSEIDMNVSSSMNLNHRIRLKDAQQLPNMQVNYSYNNHTQTVKPALTADGYYLSSMSMMAPQDLNDAVTISSITFDRVTVTGTVNFQGTGLTQQLTSTPLSLNGWARTTVSAHDYLMEVINSGTADQKQLAQMVINYGAAAQKYINHDIGSLNSNSTSLYDANAETWLKNNMVSVENDFEVIDKVSIYSTNLVIDTNLGLGTLFSVPHGFDVSGYTVAILDENGNMLDAKGNIRKDSSGNLIANSSSTRYAMDSFQMVHYDGWNDDRYRVSTNIKIGGIADSITFVVYNSNGKIVRSVTHNAAAQIYVYGSRYTFDENYTALVKALFSVYVAGYGLA